ncbi:MAG: hypothetical protein JXA71_00840 [Chitinispirillaceae bacterium]|nr:hypothetical protein [Chitinispirillaceae bacterium]
MRLLLLVFIACLLAHAGEPGSMPWESAGPARPTDTAAGKEAATQSDPLAPYINGDQGVSVQERLAYAGRCEKAAKRHSASPLNAALCKKIGDVYFDLDQVRYANKWHAWYAKAADARPSLVNETPVGFRLQEFRNIARRKNILTGVFAMYGIVLLSLGVRAIRSRGTFDKRFFFRRCAVFLGVFIIMAYAVFAIDLHCFSKSAGTVFNGKAHITPITTPVRPFIPLSAMDSSALLRAAMVLMLGFLPVALVVYYTSFKKRYSRILLSIIAVAFCSSLWLHFFISTGFDEYLKPKIMATGSRVLFGGEPEKLLLENPHKALRACPGLLKSGNEDLDKFLKQHYPEGFPGSGDEGK